MLVVVKWFNARKAFGSMILGFAKEMNTLTFLAIKMREFAS